ncbi:Arsenical resistance operon trans-acting repressor ArsD [Klebsiella pneumoniae]|nr:Arsenical resistance operon trans-acting repressor ArsD [Klebsiella pneumoniae]
MRAKAFLDASGAEGLPLLLLDGETVMAGRYPKRAELARWFGIPLEKVGLAVWWYFLLLNMSGGHMKLLQNIPPYLFLLARVV